jgi:gliding motility-associated protein GldM
MAYVSPRQKMINMIYLVLTAMLALNVSQEAVEAFKKVDKGLTQIIANYTQKNDLIYQDFDRAAAENPQKAGKQRDTAYKVKEKADAIFNFIQDLKIEIINTAEGSGNMAVNGNEIDIDEIRKIDENNVPSAILIGANENGKARDLKNMLNEYSDFLIAALEGNNPSAEESIRNMIDTKDRKEKDGQLTPWANYNFQAMPLVAVINILSEYQVTVRNAETEALNHLYSQIDASSFKFNRLVPIVIPTTSNYITLGGNYEAQVFISATDTTQQPKITVGGVELPLDATGKGIYRASATSVGTKNWGGIISLKAPDGSLKEYPFNASYIVGEQNVIVSPTAMNVMYAGIANPIDVSVPGVSPNDISVRVVNGTLTNERVRNPRGDNFKGTRAVRPNAQGQNVQVIVTANVGGRPIQFAPYEFRVKAVPTPIAVFAQKNTGTVSKATAVAQQGVFAIMPDFDFDLHYDITGFSVLYSDRGNDYEEVSTSSNLTARQKDLINRLTRGQNLIIKDIRARGPDGRNTDLSPIILKID